MSIGKFPLILILAVATLGVTAAGLGKQKADAEGEAVAATLVESARAFEKGDLPALERVWSTEETLTVFEGGSANRGWTDYRDHHLVPEMRELKELSYVLTDIKPHAEGETAWATFEYEISGKTEKGPFTGRGLGTAVLRKGAGGWRIVHWHSSAKPRKR